MSGNRYTSDSVETVLQRAREEESAERARASGTSGGRSIRATRVADLESPVLRVNKRVKRRKISTFSVILMLFGAAAVIVLYIGHIITMNHLAVDAGNLQEEYEVLLRDGGKLKAEIDRKSARERIVRIATAQLNLRLPNGQARWITVDEGAGAAPSNEEAP